MKVVRDLILPGALLLIIDAIFLSLNSQYFQTQIASVQRVALEMNPLGAILCYILLIGGLYFFVLREKRSIQYAFLLGVLIYGVYETTNLATFKKWKLQTVIMDTIWGGILFASTTYFTYRFSKLL